MKRKIYLVLESSCESRASKIFDLFIMIVIVMSVIELILESFSNFETNYHIFFTGFEVFAITIFTIEYLLRIFVAELTYPTGNQFKSRLKFLFSAYGIIDLLAISTAFLALFLILDLRFLRILRLIRFNTAILIRFSENEAQAERYIWGN